PNLIATGETDEEMAASVAKLRQHLSFYASTPTYRGVLELHGWGDLQRDLQGLAAQGRWGGMGARVPADVLDVSTVGGAPEGVAKLTRPRAAGIAHRVSFFSPALMPLE